MRSLAAPIIVVALLTASACQEPTALTQVRSGAPDLAAQGPPDIHVSSVSALYDAINTSSNAGRRIVVEASASPYMLDPTRPHGGRLELQHDMQLAGATGHSEDVVIDAAALTTTSLTDGVLTGAVRVGRGSNAIESLTIQNAAKGSGAIETDLVEAATGASPVQVRIDHVVVTGNQRGIDVRNLSKNRVLDVGLTDNTMNDNTTGQGQGVRFVNSAADGAAIHVTMKRNTAHGNTIGCLAANLNSSGASIDIDSREDRFNANGNGCIFLGGISMPSVSNPGNANGNSITVQVHAGQFADNDPSTVPMSGRGGIVVQGAVSSQNKASHNTVTIDLWGATLGNNGGIDITAWGAFSTSAQLAGTYNVVTIDVHGQPVTWARFDSAPNEAARTNRATITQ